jgi:hypothetical protein
MSLAIIFFSIKEAPRMLPPEKVVLTMPQRSYKTITFTVYAADTMLNPDQAVPLLIPQHPQERHSLITFLFIVGFLEFLVQKVELAILLHNMTLLNYLSVPAHPFNAFISPFIAIPHFSSLPIPR